MDQQQAIKTENKIKQKLKENKVFFYGLPIFMVVLILIGLLYFVFPTVSFYFSSKGKLTKLEENTKKVNQSITNLNKVKSQEEEIDSYTKILTDYIPQERRLGNIVTLIQSKANDFNLEADLVNRPRPDEEENNPKDALLESVDSGEVCLEPKPDKPNIENCILNIELNIRGDKEKFIEFVEALKDMKPLINVSYVDYQETLASEGTAEKEITATIKFQSYALKINAANISPAPAFKSDDSRLFNTMIVEKFDWGQELIKSKLIKE